MNNQSTVKELHALTDKQIKDGDERTASKMDADNESFVNALLASRYGPMIRACQKSNDARASWRRA